MGKKKPDKSELVKSIITEIGIDINSDKILMDQDNNTPIVFGGKKLKLVEEGDKLGKGEAPFDPIENRKLMASLLAYNNDKAVEDGSANPISVFYPLEPDKDGKGSIELKDAENKVYRSRPYYNDSLKIADVMFKMNGNDQDLTPYDEKIKPVTTKRRSTAKK